MYLRMWTRYLSPNNASSSYLRPFRSWAESLFLAGARSVRDRKQVSGGAGDMQWCRQDFDHSWQRRALVSMAFSPRALCHHQGLLDAINRTALHGFTRIQHQATVPRLV